MFWAIILIFGGTECVECRDQFSCFALPDLFSVVPTVPGLIFMFCSSGLILGGTEGVKISFHVLRS
jgi:hypothetical protein